LALLVAYAVLSTGLVLAYARGPRPGALFYVAVALALLPLVAAKLWPALEGVAQAAPGGVAPGVPPPQAVLVPSVGFLGLSYMALRVVDALVAVHDGVVREPPGAAAVLSYLVFVPT